MYTILTVPFVGHSLPIDNFVYCLIPVWRAPRTRSFRSIWSRALWLVRYTIYKKWQNYKLWANKCS